MANHEKIEYIKAQRLFPTLSLIRFCPYTYYSSHMNTTTVLSKGAIEGTRFSFFLGLMFLFGFLSISHAQTIYLTTDFATSDSLNSWTFQNLGDSNPAGQPSIDTLWRFTPDGTASLGFHWDNRPAISSLSGGGAIVFDSDFLDNGGTGISCDPNMGFLSCAPHEGVIASPTFNTSGDTSIIVKFYQYLRTFDAKTYIDVSTDGFATFDSIQINQEITDVPFGGETNPRDPVVVNISAFAANQPSVQIRFRFKGEYYFWIVDDVVIEGDAPIVDIALEDIVWPDTNLICYLGEEERVKLRIRNQGLSPQSNIPLLLDYVTTSFGGGFTETFSGTLQPNESIVYTFDSTVNLEELTTLIAMVDVGGDGNNDNDSRDLGLTDTCLICTDSLGGEYLCNQILVQFESNVADSTKDSIRLDFEAQLIDVCSCDELELWTIPNSVNTPQGTIGVQEVPAYASGLLDVKDAGLNYLLNLNPQDLTAISTDFFPPEASTSGTPITVGVLDSGLDFDHDAVQGRYWVNQIEEAEPLGKDPDGNCYDDDFWGGNMVEPNKQPVDILSHGTHVGGTVLNGAPTCVNTRIMTVKVVADNGQGTIFDLVCGMRYAYDEGADMLNISLGYQGEEDAVLKREVATLDGAGILMFASAGNENSNNDSLAHWPSNFSVNFDHMVAVTSVDKNDDLSTFANYGEKTVSIATKGEYLFGPVPGGASLIELKSGTSMATALVSRVASFYLSSVGGSGFNARNYILNNAISTGRLATLVQDSMRLNEDLSIYLDPACAMITSNQEDWSPQLISFPNPFDQKIQVEFELKRSSQFEIQIFNQMGQLVHRDQAIYPAGAGQWEWKPTNVSKGLYLYHIMIDGAPSQSGRWIRL